MRSEGLKAPQHWRIEIMEHNGPRAKRLRLGDGIEISAEPFRLAIGRTLGWNRLKSDLYSMEGFTFTGRGTGHGIGLCQLGADRMPGSYKDILGTFYPGSAIGLTAQGIDWHRMGGERVEVWATTERKGTGGNVRRSGAMRLRRLVACESASRRVYRSIRSFDRLSERDGRTGLGCGQHQGPRDPHAAGCGGQGHDEARDLPRG